MTTAFKIERDMGTTTNTAGGEATTGDRRPVRGDPRWERFRTCESKVRFADAPKDFAGWMRAYRCRFCEGWHLTSKPRSGKQKVVDHQSAAASSEVVNEVDGPQ